MSPNTPANTSRAKRSKRARFSKPRLHADLETMVLDTFQHSRNSQDLTWLWVGGRHVSKHFRGEIERMFRIVFLPETILRCDMGIRLLCWDIFEFDTQIYAGCYTEMSSVSGQRTPCFTLDRFSNDQTRAFFKCGNYDAGMKSVFRRLHEKQLVEAPVFSIQVREVVNDTGIPGLQIDDEKEEISFDWRGMLDQLMGEEHVFDTILSQRLGWQLDPGEGTHNILEMHRKLARRSRLQRECRAKYQSNILDHYVHNEAGALKMLPQLRLAASGSESTHINGDDDNNMMKNPTVYITKQQILDELPKDAIIYSGNSSPGPKPGSIPRGIFTDRDYCSPENRWRGLPPPSSLDLFSPRPLPDLSWGRRPLDPPQKPKKEHEPRHGKRAREEDLWRLLKKRSKNATE